MSKLHRVIGSLIITTLLLVNPHFIINRAGSNSFGVNEGEMLKFTSLDKPKRPGFTEGSDFPLGISLSDIRALSKLITDNFILQPIFDPFPPENTNFTVEIVELEESTREGTLNISSQVNENISDGRINYQLPLNNSLGEPVVSTDWQEWMLVIDSLAALSSIDGKKIIDYHYSLSEQTFKSSILFKSTIPNKLKLYLSSVKVNQTLCYDTSTGIQAYMIVITVFSIVLFGAFTSVSYYKYAGEFSESLDNISIITKPFDPLQIFLPILGGLGVVTISVLVLIILRKRLK